MNENITIYDLGLEKKTLYQCRSCGAVAAVSVGGCPSCGCTDGGTTTVQTFDGDSEEKQLPWYKTIEVIVDG